MQMRKDSKSNPKGQRIASPNLFETIQDKPCLFHEESSIFMGNKEKRTSFNTKCYPMDRRTMFIHENNPNDDIDMYLDSALVNPEKKQRVYMTRRRQASLEKMSGLMPKTKKEQPIKKAHKSTKIISQMIQENQEMEIQKVIHKPLIDFSDEFSKSNQSDQDQSDYFSQHDERDQQSPEFGNAHQNERESSKESLQNKLKNPQIYDNEFSHMKKDLLDQLIDNERHHHEFPGQLFNQENDIQIPKRMPTLNNVQAQAQISILANQNNLIQIKNLQLPIHPCKVTNKKQNKRKKSSFVQVINNNYDNPNNVIYNFMYQHQPKSTQQLLSQRLKQLNIQTLHKTAVNLNQCQHVLKQFDKSLQIVTNYHKLKQSKIKVLDYQLKIYQLLKSQVSVLGRLLSSRKEICSNIMYDKMEKNKTAKFMYQ